MILYYGTETGRSTVTTASLGWFQFWLVVLISPPSPTNNIINYKTVIRVWDQEEWFMVESWPKEGVGWQGKRGVGLRLLKLFQYLNFAVSFWRNLYFWNNDSRSRVGVWSILVLFDFCYVSSCVVPVFTDSKNRVNSHGYRMFSTIWFAVTILNKDLNVPESSWRCCRKIYRLSSGE